MFAIGNPANVDVREAKEKKLDFAKSLDRMRLVNASFMPEAAFCLLRERQEGTMMTRMPFLQPHLTGNIRTISLSHT